MTYYAFTRGYFVTWADQPFSVTVYEYKNDRFVSKIYARYVSDSGRYEVETGAGDFTYYCILSNENKGTPMTNAVYRSVPYNW